MTETFPIAPGHVRAVWMAAIIVPIILVAVGIVVAMFVTLRASQTARFEISPQGLRLRGDFYGRLIPARELRIADARVVNLNTERLLAPIMRTMGTALPGYRAGWFRLRDGERALLYVTDASRVAYVPTTEGYSVLLSVADPAHFLDSLKQAMAR